MPRNRLLSPRASLVARAFVVAFALGLAPVAYGQGAPAPAAGNVVMRIGDRQWTADELKAELSWEPAPLLERARDDANFGRTYAVRWYESELLVRAAGDDGVLVRVPGLAGAARNLGRPLIAGEYVKQMLEVEYKPTDAEVQSYYAMNKETCKVPARYHLARLGVQVAKNASQPELEGAKKRLTTMQERLKGGEAFGKVADEMSDLPAKKEGGDVGWIGDDELGEEEGVAILRSLAVGATSEPIKTRRGLEIFKLVEREDARTKTLDQCRPQLVEQINAEYRKAASRKRVDELARRYNASLNLDAFLAAVAEVPGRPLGKAGKGAGDDESVLP